MPLKSLEIDGITNGYVVDDSIWRGAQPEDFAWIKLAEAGCCSVVDLNNKGIDQQKQSSLVEAQHMIYAAYPWDGILPPSQAQVGQVLNRMDALPKPIFVHCLHGSDRTGTLCAIWRMYHDKWAFGKAMWEAFTGLGLHGEHEFWMAAAAAEYAHLHGLAAR